MTKQANTPKSRKPAKAQNSAPVQAEAPASSNLAAQLATASAQSAVKPAEKAKRSTPDLKLVIVKDFKPRTDQLVAKKADNGGNYPQKHNWDALVAAIQAHGGAITYAEAVQAVLDAGTKGNYPVPNARGFVQARLRNGHVKAA